MEFQPEGTVFLELILKGTDVNEEFDIVTREVYSWNKVTTCIHNLFGTGNLWADLYGECRIKCIEQTIKRRKNQQHLKGKRNSENFAGLEQNIENEEEVLYNSNTPVMTCKLEFLSASGGGYWSNNKRDPHEIQGVISNDKGKHIVKYTSL